MYTHAIAFPLFDLVRVISYYTSQLMPPGEREAMIDKAFYFAPDMEGEIETYLEKVCPTLEPGSGVWGSIVVPFARDLGISEDSSDNVL